MAIVRPDNCHGFVTAFLLGRQRRRKHITYHPELKVSGQWWRALDWEREARARDRYAHIHNIWWRSQPVLLALVVVFGSLWLASR